MLMIVLSLLVSVMVVDIGVVGSVLLEKCGW